MTITKRVTFIAKEGCEAKMKELLSAMVVPSKAEEGVIFYEIFQYANNPRIKQKKVLFFTKFFNMKVIQENLWHMKVGKMKQLWMGIKHRRITRYINQAMSHIVNTNTLMN